MVIGIGLILLSVLGLIISIIFMGIDHQKFASLRKYAGFICDEVVCSSVLRLSDSQLFRIKNYYLGILSYVVMIASAVLFLLTSQMIFQFAVTIISGIMLILSIYLFVRLIWVHRMKCIFCFTSHGLVLVIFLVSLL